MYNPSRAIRHHRKASSLEPNYRDGSKTHDCWEFFEETAGAPVASTISLQPGHYILMMATAESAALSEDSMREPINNPNILAGQPQSIHSPPMASTPVEMTQFGQQAIADDTVHQTPVSASVEAPPRSKEDPIQESPTVREDPGTNAADKSSSSTPAPITTPLIRKETAPAIGSSSDKPIPIPKESDLAGPTLIITLLLTSGARHPYKIDEKYLKKRGVNVEGNNPVNMSVYTLKELIWREWREGENSPTIKQSLILDITY